MYNLIYYVLKNTCVPHVHVTSMNKWEENLYTKEGVPRMKERTEDNNSTTASEHLNWNIITCIEHDENNIIEDKQMSYHIY